MLELFRRVLLRYVLMQRHVLQPARRPQFPNLHRIYRIGDASPRAPDPLRYVDVAGRLVELEIVLNARAYPLLACESPQSAADDGGARLA